jgi:hypothetical protein
MTINASFPSGPLFEQKNAADCAAAAFFVPFINTHPCNPPAMNRRFFRDFPAIYRMPAFDRGFLGNFPAIYRGWINPWEKPPAALKTP